MNPLVTIIVPFYNAASFIEDVIISIVNQTCDYEAIFVDDGSKDDGYRIIEKYAVNNSRIKLIRQNNQGANRARATGVENARGRWIVFLDADDLFLDSFSGIINKWNHVFDGDVIVTYNELLPIQENHTIDAETYRRGILTQNIHTGPWCKIYKRSLFSNFVFDLPSDIISAEDFLMNIRLALNVKQDVMMTIDNYYKYRGDVNPQSAMKTFKGSEEYDRIYLECLEASFSPTNKEKYREFILKWKLSRWHQKYRKIHRIRLDEFSSALYREILQEIKICDYKLSIAEYCNLRLKNTFCRAIMDYCLRISGVIKSYIKPIKRKCNHELSILLYNSVSSQ